MRLLAVLVALAVLAPMPARAEPDRPPEASPVEKLPVSLPELTVIGQEDKPEIETGAKLAVDASPSVGALPPPPPARATTELLDRLRLPVPGPPEALRDPGVPVDRDPYTRVWGGMGSLPLGHLGSYDAGFYHGQRVGGLLSITDVAADLHGLDRRSTVRASEQLAWGEDAWGTLGYRREEQGAAGSATARQEGGKLAASFARDSYSLSLEGEVGNVLATGIPQAGSVTAYGVTARGQLRPEPLIDDHRTTFGLQLGQSGAAGPGGGGYASPFIAVSAADRFHPLEPVAVETDLGLTLFRQAVYLDPGLRVEYRPKGPISAGGVADSPTELWAAASTRTRQPGFEELYQSRLRTVGNADLRPERIQPRLEVGAGHRFTDRLYASVTLGASQALDWIHHAPAGAGLWQPRNFGAWQQVYDLEMDSQYLWSDLALQRFGLRLRNPAGLGERLLSGTTRHESLWLGEKLAVGAGLVLDYVELGPSQGGGSGLDLRAEWDVGYRIAPGWQLFVAGKEWHVVPTAEPSDGYFATPARITAGVKLDF